MINIGQGLPEMTAGLNVITQAFSGMTGNEDKFIIKSGKMWIKIPNKKLVELPKLIILENWGSADSTTDINMQVNLEYLTTMILKSDNSYARWSVIQRYHSSTSGYETTIITSNLIPAGSFSSPSTTTNRYSFTKGEGISIPSAVSTGSSTVAFADIINCNVALFF